MANQDSNIPQQGGSAPQQGSLTHGSGSTPQKSGSSSQKSSGTRQKALAAPQRDHSGDLHVHRSAKPKQDMSHIQGWGADLDHKNRPAYPMERTPPRLEGVQPGRPEDQPVKMTIYHSTERPGITPIFGTSTPPSGISGMLRGVAYKLSENDIRHWLLLLLADRVNVVEGIGQDLMSGHIPNVFGEMGIKAEFKHNPAGLARKAAVATAVLGLGYYLLKRRRSSY